MLSHTVTLHRVLRAPPERVYRAFLNADAMSKWLPPNGFAARVHEMDARVGGRYRMTFTNFSSGHSDDFGGEYLELVPHERIRYTAVFDDPNLPGQMQTTVTLKAVFCGTEMTVEIMRTVAPVSPGEMLEEEFLKPLGLTKYRLAKDIDVPPQRIGDIVAGKRGITADTDLRLCRYFGLSDGWWLRGQASYDTAVAREAMGDVLKQIPRCQLLAA